MEVFVKGFVPFAVIILLLTIAFTIFLGHVNDILSGMKKNQEKIIELLEKIAK